MRRDALLRMTRWTGHDR